MQLLKLDENTLRNRYAQPRLDGTPSSQLRASVFLLVRFTDSQEKTDFESRCREYRPARAEFVEDPSNELQTLMLIRADISKFFRYLDPNWPGEPRYGRSPDEIQDQWKQTTVSMPALTAAGAMVENLREKPVVTDETSPTYVWIQHEAKALDGSPDSARLCTELFTTWLSNVSSAPGSYFAAEARKENDPGALIEQLLARLNAQKNVILEGVAGSGKTHCLDALRTQYEDRITVLVFHPSTSYEDFVVGLRPIGSNFTAVPGSFMLMCERATRDPQHNYLLFIDEINRANTARVLGDLLMVIEASKRSSSQTLSQFDDNMENDTEFWTWKADNYRSVLTDQELRSRGPISSVQLQTALDASSGSLGRRKHLVVPSNLHVLGTMNTTDRSVGTIDLALRRRFSWITSEVLGGEKLSDVLGTERAAELDAVIKWHEFANMTLGKLIGPDSLLGHSYFFAHNATARDVAESLVNQLAEVAHTFNFDDGLVERLFGDEAPELPAGLRLYQRGRGLGKRFVTTPVEREPNE